MNEFLPTPINEKKVKKTLALTLLLLCLVPTVLNIVCLTPLYFGLENNTVYRGTAITLTLKYISDLFDLISFASIYSIVSFSLILLKKKTTVAVAISYFILLILKIPARLVMNIPLYGTIGTKEEIIADVISLSFYFFLEILQFTLAFIFSAIVANSYLSSVEIIRANKKSKNTQKIEHILPVKKFVNWYNPLLRAACFSSITVIAFKFIARLITDIDAGAATSFGEVMIIIVNYLTDAVYGVVAYIIAIFIFNLLFEKLTKGNGSSDSKENKADEKTSSALFED